MFLHFFLNFKKTAFAAATLICCPTILLHSEKNTSFLEVSIISDGDLYLDGTEIAASYDPLNTQPVKLEKLIKVNLDEQRLEYFFDGKLFDSFLISSGLASMPTPEGEFVILDKVPVKHYGGGDYDYPNTKWNLHFTTQRYRYYIHGAYWHDNFGQKMSHGCVNVDYDHMEPLYWWSQYNTKVIIE